MKYHENIFTNLIKFQTWLIIQVSWFLNSIYTKGASFTGHFAQLTKLLDSPVPNYQTFLLTK